ncbi:lysophospholipid acyltransferase family protein [Histidinibacterium lentulum]|uniref:DUF374 domain-containing protein n=1 Tax=Histidinibacterium lentulum TaxID=2480588 RepID=A0A3N2R4Q5_9RHOB|nr:DUF374 domain-containing protein [Histidinibacterium lentulum]ROU02475.1 DUF374 domain-containing protein [Histidinibacterium lentulum]
MAARQDRFAKRTRRRAEDVLHRLAVRVYGAWMAFAWRTIRWDRQGLAPWEEALRGGSPFVLASWHGRLSMVPYVFDWRRLPFTVLAFEHPAARLVSHGLPRLGIEVVEVPKRGSRRPAVTAAIAAVRAGRCLGLTPDGPAGPAFEAKAGVIDIAALTGAPVVPISFSARPRIVARSWDRFVLPLPFGRGTIRMGAAIPVPKGMDPATRETVRARIEAALDALDAECDAAMGQRPIPRRRRAPASDQELT